MGEYSWSLTSKSNKRISERENLRARILVPWKRVMTGDWGKLWSGSVRGSVLRSLRRMLRALKTQLQRSLSKLRFHPPDLESTFPSLTPIYICLRFSRVFSAQSDGWRPDSERLEADRRARPRYPRRERMAEQAVGRERPQSHLLDVPDGIHSGRDRVVQTSRVRDETIVHERIN
jgi:hypothetical protein